MQEPAFNWRVSLGIAIGLVVLFGALFGLRALHIFPREPGQDPEIAAARATQAALQTQAVLAPKPTTGAVAVPAAAPTVNPPEFATPAPIPTRAPTPPATQQSVAASQPAPTTATLSQTAGAPVGTSPTVQSTAEPTTVPSLGSSAVATPTALANPISTAGAPTPVAVNLPADLANAILEGYSNYWTVRLNAMRDPDTSIDLASVMADKELAGAQKTLAQYRDGGEAFDATVKHTIWITRATAEEAVVVDRYSGKTTQLDPSTKEPLSPDPLIQNFSDRFLLRNMDGAWKVVQEEPEQ
jgi:hypothetical protein